jgi:transcription antitermination protein NusB
MVNRHVVREMGMKLLYLWETTGSNDTQLAHQLTSDESQDPKTRQRALDLAGGAWEQRQATDRWVERMAPKWPSHRQPPVDRAILRLAVYELINTPTPSKVVIDEAIELAKAFSTSQSAAFINGVLDSILKEHQAITSASDRSDEGDRSGERDTSGEATKRPGEEG